MKSSQHVSDSLTFSLLIGPHWEPSQAFSPLFCFTWPRISAASITALCPLELPLRIEQHLSILKWLERIVSVVLWVKLISGVGHIFASSVGSIMQDRSLSCVFSHFSSYLRGVFNYLVTDWVWYPVSSSQQSVSARVTTDSYSQIAPREVFLQLANKH